LVTHAVHEHVVVKELSAGAALNGRSEEM
jgi:hypothetical protein